MKTANGLGILLVCRATTFDIVSQKLIKELLNINTANGLGIHLVCRATTFDIVSQKLIRELFNMFNKPPRGGLVVQRLLHKKCHSATVDRIPSKYGVLIVQS